MSRICDVSDMTEEQIEAVKAAVASAVGRRGLYYVIMVDEDNAETLTNIHRDDIGRFLSAMTEQTKDSMKLLRMKAAGRT